jgi:hypothetical protein
MLNQPVSSQIKVIRKNDSLEILIPAKNSIAEIALGVLYKLWYATISFSVILTFIAITHYVQFGRMLNQKDLEVLSHFTPFAILMLFPLVAKNLFDLFGRAVIQINRHQVQLSYSLFSFKFYSDSEREENLIKIIRRLRKRSRSLSMKWERIPLTDEPCLSIYSQRKILDIRSNNINDEEIEWLSVFLAHQLSLPLQK